jgi:hypothetical protein
MTVKTAFKYISLTLLILVAAGIIYVIQAGFAIVKVTTQDTRIWLPVPIALGQLVGKMVEFPLKHDEQFQEFWKYREEIGQILHLLPGLPDADFVEVQSAKEHVRIFKRGDSFCVQVNGPDEQVNARLPIETIERLAEAFDEPSPDLGDFFASLKGQSAGDLIYVKSNTEEVKISIW